jgi:hypothetical protein
MRHVTTFIPFVLAACAVAPPAESSEPAVSALATNEPSSSEAAASSEAATAEIVGEWRGQHECEGIAEALGEAGFDATVVLANVAGNGLVPGVSSLGELDPDNPCEGAVAVDHSHVFTADGQFQSLDAAGEEVDFGTWEAVDEDTIVIGAPDRADVTFDYAVDGDRLTLEPQLATGCTGFECQWAVMVAMSWSDMERVDPGE